MIIINDVKIATLFAFSLLFPNTITQMPSMMIGTDTKYEYIDKKGYRANPNVIRMDPTMVILVFIFS